MAYADCCSSGGPAAVPADRCPLPAGPDQSLHWSREDRGGAASPSRTMQVVIERYIAAVLTGRSVADIHRILRGVTDVVAANLYAKAAVEVALHDAWARSLGVPVHTLLGGH